LGSIYKHLTKFIYDNVIFEAKAEIDAFKKQPVLVLVCAARDLQWCWNVWELAKHFTSTGFFAKHIL